MLSLVLAAAIAATCSVNGGTPTRCQMLTSVDNGLAGVGIVLPSRENLTVVGRITSATTFSVDAVDLNGKTFPSYGQCTVTSVTVRCRFGPTASSPDVFTLNVVVDTI